MADLPTADQVFGKRATPRSSRGEQSYNAGAVQDAQAQVGNILSDAAAKTGRVNLQAISDSGKMFEQMSIDIDNLRIDREKQASKINMAKAQSFVLQEATALEDAIMQDQDYRSAEKKWGEGFSKIRSEALGLVSPEDRELFDYSLNDWYVKGNSTAKKHAYEMDGKRLAGEFLTQKDNITQVVTQAAASGDEAKAIAAIQVTENAGRAAQAAGAFRGSQDNGESQIAGIKREMFETAMGGMTPAQKLNILKPRFGPEAKTSANDFIMHTIKKTEGGYVASDGASNAPAIYGINRASWPKEFDKAKEITDTQGPEAGEQYAAEFYKREYWDKNKLDRFSPDVSKVLFDGIINHYPGFGKRLIEKADAGADAEELLAMRDAEYQRLGAKPDYASSLPGWNNRLINLRGELGQGGVSQLASYIPPEERQKLYTAAEKEDIAARMDDNPNEALVGLVDGKLGLSLSAEEKNTLIGQAKNAVTMKYDREQTIALSREAVQFKDDYNQILAKQPSQADVERLKQQGKLRLAAFAEQKISKPTEVPTPPTDVRTRKFIDLTNKLSGLKKGIGGTATEMPDEVKLNAGIMRDFRAFQEEVLDASSAKKKLITQDQATRLLDNFSTGIITAIEEGTTEESDYWFPSGDDPYLTAFDKIDGIMAAQNLSNDFYAKGEVIMALDKYFGQFDDKGKYQVTGEFKSTGNTVKDEQIINQAIKLSIDDFNRRENPELMNVEELPNIVIPTPKAATETAPVPVKTPEEANKLDRGTRFITPDGRVKVRP